MTKLKQIVRLNYDSFTIIKTSEKMEIKQQSLRNLTGKTGSGFMSARSSNELRRTVYNLLSTVRDQKQAKETTENKALPHIPPQNPTHKGSTRRDVGNANVPCNQKKASFFD